MPIAPLSRRFARIPGSREEDVMSNPSKPQSEPPLSPDRNPKAQEKLADTEPAQEWGTRLDQGRAIHRGGKTDGHVPGATEQR